MGNVDIRIQSNAEQLGMEETVKKANISIEQLAGVLIQGSDQTVYATVWDEEEIRVTQFQEFVISEEKTASRESSKPETNMDSGEDSKPEKNIASKEVSGTGKTTESNKSSNKEAEKTQVQLHMEEMEEELRTVDWDAMRNHGIPMAPFEEERQDAVYLRIEPQHLKYFPEHWWHLGRNSFLLHGYYNYRYLIIGKLGDEIILGIPGNYYPMEETVAAMFGFGTFRAARKHMQEIGCFGYWCRKIS